MQDWLLENCASLEAYHKRHTKPKTKQTSNKKEFTVNMGQPISGTDRHQQGCEGIPKATEGLRCS